MAEALAAAAEFGFNETDTLLPVAATFTLPAGGGGGGGVLGLLMAAPATTRVVNPASDAKKVERDTRESVARPHRTCPPILG